jgi:hypothetical protein
MIADAPFDPTIQSFGRNKSGCRTNPESRNAMATPQPVREASAQPFAHRRHDEPVSAMAMLMVGFLSGVNHFDTLGCRRPEGVSSQAGPHRIKSDAWVVCISPRA